jgi:hypothetical protein
MHYNFARAHTAVKDQYLRAPGDGGDRTWALEEIAALLD